MAIFGSLSGTPAQRSPPSGLGTPPPELSPKNEKISLRSYFFFSTGKCDEMLESTEKRLRFHAFYANLIRIVGTADCNTDFVNVKILFCNRIGMKYV